MDDQQERHVLLDEFTAGPFTMRLYQVHLYAHAFELIIFDGHVTDRHLVYSVGDAARGRFEEQKSALVKRVAMRALGVSE